jgi:hypothetical protein
VRVVILGKDASKLMDTLHVRDLRAMDTPLESFDQISGEPHAPESLKQHRELLDSQCTRSELLWRLYIDNREYARTHEGQRAMAANLIVAISAGLVGLATFDQKLTTADLPLTFFLMAVGLFGTVFSSKHYERTRLHLNRAKQFLKRLDELFPEDRILALQKQGDEDNNRAFPRLAKIKLNSLWNMFYTLISLLGFVLSCYIVVLAFFSHG